MKAIPTRYHGSKGKKVCYIYVLDLGCFTFHKNSA